MVNQPLDYRRALHTAAWIWLAYLGALVLIDLPLLQSDQSGPIIWYHLVNFIPAVIFLGLSYFNWLPAASRGIAIGMILLISAVPILLFYLMDVQLPPVPLSNLEGQIFRQLPYLLIGLVLVAWRYDLSAMVLYSLAINLFEWALASGLNRISDPRYTAFFSLLVIRTACFIVVGAFILQLLYYLRLQAIRDSLTGLYNRHYLNEFFGQYLARAGREGTPLACVMIDIDHFKHFNDTYGHLAGDAMLRAVGKLFSKSTRQGDIACRFGGEEFIIILPGASLQDASKRTEEIRRSLEATRVVYAGNQLSVTISAGLSIYPKHGHTAESLIKAADEALYAAKQAGRNRLVSAAMPSPQP